MTRRREPAQGRTARSTTPPLDQLPPDLRKVAEEYRRLSRELADVGNAEGDLRRRKDQAEAEAREADAKATSAAARAGKPQLVTTAVDALVARREELQRTKAALTEAVSTVGHEFDAARYQWELTGEPTDAVTKARAKLEKATAALAAALTATAHALAVEEWVKGEHYDDSLKFTPADLMPGLLTQTRADAAMYDASLDAADLLRTITTL